MSKDFARKGMWDSDYRPEQIFVRDYLASTNLTWKIVLEYPVKNLKIDGKPYRKCILDIAVPENKLGIRLNGGYHHVSSRQQLKDELQKEALQQIGWKIVDFDSYKMPYLFKTKYNEKTVKLVIEEIKNELGDLFG